LSRRRHYVARTEDGRYGLTSSHELWKIAGSFSYLAGHVSDRSELEAAARIADEEMAAELHHYDLLELWNSI